MIYNNSQEESIKLYPNNAIRTGIWLLKHTPFSLFPELLYFIWVRFSCKIGV